MIIIHVIGPAFAGKSSFIKQYLSTEIIFDIRADFYEPKGIDPEEYKGKAYEKLRQLLAQELSNRLRQAQAEKKFLVIESSGTNQAINDFIKNYNDFIILVWTPRAKIVERVKVSVNDILIQAGYTETDLQAFWSEASVPNFEPQNENEQRAIMRLRSAYKINRHFDEEFANGNIIYHTRFFPLLSSAKTPYYYPPFSISQLRQRYLGREAEYPIRNEMDSF
jgi:predicted kinase